MIPPDALPSYDLRTLRYAEHFCAWALRTSVACSPQCRTLLCEFHRAFGDQKDEAIASYHDLITCLGQGIRKVRIGRPGHIHLTADELSLVHMLGAAAYRDRDRFEAHARWIMGHDHLEPLYQASQHLTTLLENRGHTFRKPPAAETPADLSVPVSIVIERAEAS